jgi:Zn-dependent protease with chaperone function
MLVAYLPLLLPALVALAAWPVARRLPPGLATWLLSASSVVLAGATGAALCVLAVAGALRIPVVTSLGHMSARALRQGDPAGSVPVAVVAAVILALALAAAGRATWRRGRALAAARQAAACLPAGGLTVVDDEAADAFAVPGLTSRQGRVVVSTGMLAVLDAPQRHALLAHERAHLSGRHHLFLAAAHLAASANPLLRPAERAVAYTIERWADERAAEVTGDRRAAALAVGKAALAKTRRPGSGAAAGVVLAADGHAGGRADGGGDRFAGMRQNRLARMRLDRLAPGGRKRLSGAGPVPQRVAALLGPPPRLRPRGRLMLAAAVAAVAVISAASTGLAAADLHHVVETAQAAAPGQVDSPWFQASWRRWGGGLEQRAHGRFGVITGAITASDHP